jgi:hypothetical protein
MKPQPNLAELFSAWRAEPLPPTRTAPTREGSIAIAYALREVARKRRRRSLLRRSSIAVAVAAGVFGIVLSLWMHDRSAAPLAARQVSSHDTSGEQSAPSHAVLLNDSVGDVRVVDAHGSLLRDPSGLAEGYGVRTGEGSASLGFSSGALARVARGSALTLTATERTESLLLTRGRVDVEVPKLDRERGFSVETPDAKVVVHGTGFSVSVAPENEREIRTAVSVTHGVVSVQHQGREVRLSAGQHWPDDFEAPAAADAGDESLERDVETSKESVREKPRGKHAGKATRSRRAPSARESRELAEQNGHFARAMLLKNQGQAQDALSELTHLLRSHPASPLRQEARVERLRILRSLGRRDEARREASRYLSDFPDGYAAQEARELLEEP